MIRYRCAFFLMTALTVMFTLWTFQASVGRLLPVTAMFVALFFGKKVASLLAVLTAAGYVSAVLVLQGTAGTIPGGLAIDVGIFLVTFVSAGIVGTLVSDIEDAVAHLIPLQIGRDTPDDAVCQQRFEDEVRRARRFDRPLSLVGFRLEDEPSAPCPELIHELLRRYAKLSVQGLMVEEIARRTMESDIIAVRNGVLVAMLPETSIERADHLLSRLRRPLELISGSRIRIASVAFPLDQSTVSGMLDQLDTLLADDPPPTERPGRGVVEESEQLAG